MSSNKLLLKLVLASVCLSLSLNTKISLSEPPSICPLHSISIQHTTDLAASEKFTFYISPESIENKPIFMSVASYDMEYNHCFQIEPQPFEIKKNSIDSAKPIAFAKLTTKYSDNEYIACQYSIAESPVESFTIDLIQPNEYVSYISLCKMQPQGLLESPRNLNRSFYILRMGDDDDGSFLKPTNY